jgi:hypothetical protein
MDEHTRPRRRPLLLNCALCGTEWDRNDPAQPAEPCQHSEEEWQQHYQARQAKGEPEYQARRHWLPVAPAPT